MTKDTEVRFRIQDFLDIKRSWGATWSPHGEHIAFLNNLTGVAQLCVMDSGGDGIKRLTSYDEPIEFAHFSPAKNEIIFGMSQGGNEKTQFYLINTETDAVRRLTRNEETMHRWDAWSRDGQNIAYASNARNGKDFDVYLMDVETGRERCVFEPGGWCDACSFSPDGKSLIVRRQHTFLQHDLYLVELDSGITTHLTPHEGKAEYGTPSWIDDHSFFFAHNEGREFAGLDKYDLRKRKMVNLLSPSWDVEEIGISWNRRLLTVTLNEEGYVSTSILDTANGQFIQLNGLPKGINEGFRWSPDDSKLLFTHEDSKRQGEIWSWDRGTDKSRRLTNSPRAIPEAICREERLVRFTSFDGLQIPGFLYLPARAQSEKLPLIINIHGGPEGQARPMFNPLIQYFVNRGYAVLTPNVRGSSGYGKTFLGLDDGRNRWDTLKDLQAIHDAVAGWENIDAKRLALIGGSYGGFMVLAGLAFQPECWTAGVDIVGMSNLVTFLQNTSEWRRALREAEYGSLEHDRDFLEALSPFNSVEKIIAPLFVIHGANDPRVPLQEARQIIDRLNSMGRDAELLIYADEGHGLFKLKNRLDAYPKVAEFLDRHLMQRKM